MMDLYGVGDHGGGPTRAMLDEGFRWAQPDAAAITADGGAPVTPHYEFGTAQSFFSSVEKQIAPDSPCLEFSDPSANCYTASDRSAGKSGRFQRGILSFISSTIAA